MWQMIVNNIQKQTESERLKQAEKNIQELKDAIAKLEDSFGKMEKKEHDKENI